MARYLKKMGTDNYLDGLYLLSLCQKLVKEAVESEVVGSGTADNPYTLNNCGQWINRWRKSSKEDKNVYYKVAGRLILKDQSLRVGDVGPAYLKHNSIMHSYSSVKLDPEIKQEKDPIKKDILYKKKLDEWLKKHPELENVVDPFKEIDEWLKKNTIHSPTYQTGAQRFVDPGLIYFESSNALEMAGGNRTAPWSNIRNSPKIARAIRLLLKGESLSLGSNTGTYDKDYSRKQFMLPVYTMAIFHSEPARNERAWPINLMMLDLAESAAANFTWDAILWHPEAINPASHQMVTARVMGPEGSKPEERKIVPVTSTKKLHLVGGLMPGSPTGGGERGKPGLWKPFKDPNGPGQFLKIPFDYIHQKEIDVLFKWLLHLPQIGYSWSEYEGSTIPQPLINVNDVLTGIVPHDAQLTKMLTEIKKQVTTRITTLNKM